jgi:hypothetical protein
MNYTKSTQIIPWKQDEMYKASTRNYLNQLMNLIYGVLGIKLFQFHFHKLQPISLDKSQFWPTLVPQFPHFVGNINPKDNITQKTPSNDDDSSFKT